MDAEYHFYGVFCTKCGAAGQSPNEPHDWEDICEVSEGGGYPAGTHYFVCKICNGQKFEIPGGSTPCTHANTTKKWDDTNHWDECNDCHAKLNEAAHTKGALAHNASTHWYPCSGCSVHLDEESHTPDGYKYSDGEHWTECACGQEIEGSREAHTKVEHKSDTEKWTTCTCGWESAHEALPTPTAKPSPTPEIHVVEPTATVKPTPAPSGEVVITSPKPSKTPKATEQVHTTSTFTLTIHYVAENAEDQTKMTKDVNAKVYAGDYYRYRSPDVHDMYPDIRVVEGKMPNGDLTITVTYGRTQTTAPKDTFMLTIHYVAADPQYQSKMPATYHEVVQKALGEVLDGAEQKYTYKKTKANSFIIEFTDEFLEEQEDGEYELIVMNGEEYWPMIVVVKDHKFVEIKNLPDEGADAPRVDQ